MIQRDTDQEPLECRAATALAGALAPADPRWTAATVFVLGGGIDLRAERGPGGWPVLCGVAADLPARLAARMPTVLGRPGDGDAGDRCIVAVADGAAESWNPGWEVVAFAEVPEPLRGKARALRPVAFPGGEELVELAGRALAEDAARMDGAREGEAGLEVLAGLVEGFVELAGETGAGEMLGQWIAAVGPGGGLMRRLYRDGLRELSGEVPSIASGQLDFSMGRVNDAWRTFGMELEELRRQPSRGAAQAQRLLLAAQTFEETFWERIRRTFGEGG